MSEWHFQTWLIPTPPMYISSDNLTENSISGWIIGPLLIQYYLVQNKSPVVFVIFHPNGEENPRKTGDR